MKASDYIAHHLQRQGVTHVFELIGGMITFLVDSLHQQTSIKIVSMHHEQGAGFAAEGYARVRGTPGVAMATSGPGATNLLTAIGSCYFDSVPTVFITGQVNRHEQKGDRKIRQLGFQETDIVSMARPITKAAWLVNEPADLPRLLDEAFALAVIGRPGPVLIDIPMDVQRATIEGSPEPRLVSASGRDSKITAVFIEKLSNALRSAKRPLILAGGGVVSNHAMAAFRNFVEHAQIPVVNSLMAVDALPGNHPLRVGLIGSYGNRWANTAMSESDVLLVLGSRLDIRQTGADTKGFKGERQIFHVDCDAGEMNNRVTGCHPLESDVAAFLNGATFINVRAPADWLQHIAAMKTKWPDTGELKDLEGINPNQFLRQLAAASEQAAAYVVDVGQHQMWAAQSLQLNPSQRFMTSGGMGAMGFSLPAAIGACLAANKPVVVVAGDGGFQLNIQELQTVARNQLPLKIVVVNNHCHGMVRQFQDSYFKGRVQSTVWGYSAPSFTAVASAYGIKSAQVSDSQLVSSALASLWEDPSAPFLLEVIVDLKANAYPKMAFGRPMADMEPFAKPLEMEGT